MMPELIVLAFVALIVWVLYALPIPDVPFEEVYARVGEATRHSLQTFRRDRPLLRYEVDGVTWRYIVMGQGPEAVLFLHGIAGAYDIWWQVLEALQGRYRLISVTYPPVAGLEAMSQGLLAILDREDVGRVTVVGSSLGGYLAQYLAAHHPDRIERAVFANTFPPNERIAQQNRVLGTLLPLLPAWFVMRFLRRNVETSIYPAAGHSELVRAYLREQSYRGGMSKAQFVARYRCVVDPFTPPDIEAVGIPSLLVEADNDPLVEQELRERLKHTYPAAQVQTLHAVGHFPYLNEPTAYAGLLQAFLSGSSAKGPASTPVERSSA